MQVGGRTPGVRLDRDAWDLIRRATVLASPREACGYLGGAFASAASTGGVITVGRAVEVANESSKDRRYHFAVPAARVREAAVRLEREFYNLIGFFHSHPDGGPTPSEEDVERARPGQLHLISTVGATGVVRVNAFEFDADDGTPRELQVMVVDGRSSSLRAFSPSSSQVESCRA